MPVADITRLGCLLQTWHVCAAKSCFQMERMKLGSEKSGADAELNKYVLIVAESTKGFVKGIESFCGVDRILGKVKEI